MCVVDMAVYNAVDGAGTIPTRTRTEDFSKTNGVKFVVSGKLLPANICEKRRCCGHPS